MKEITKENINNENKCKSQNILFIRKIIKLKIIHLLLKIKRKIKMKIKYI